jgi:YidC/Oxa1 family membrane protein insertase
VGLHKLVSFLGQDTAWVVGIILLTVCVRILLFPLFVKQTKAQRQMQVLAPQVQALKEKYKGDKQTLNVETMKLYKENGANPLMGCGPLLLQMPIFIGLFRVLNAFRPTTPGKGYVGKTCLDFGGKIISVTAENADKVLCFKEHYGIDPQTVRSGGLAQLFGAPISTGFSSNKGLLEFLHSPQSAVKIVAAALILGMAITTFVSQKQLMAKAGPVEGSAATQQKVLLYVMPVLLMVFGLNVPLGVLLYWTTTNLWSMGQQAYIIKRMPMPATGTTGGSAGRSSKPAPPSGKKSAAVKPPSSRPAGKEGTGSTGRGAAKPPPKTDASTKSASNGAGDPDADAPRTGAPRPQANRPANKKKSKGGRRGGRR